MYPFILIYKPTSYSLKLTISPFYIISLPRTELLNCSFTFIVHVVSRYEYGACKNGCMSVWMSSNAAKGVCVEAKGVMIEYILYIYNNGFPTHAHGTLMYVLIANLSNIECLSRKDIYLILKPSLTIIFLSFNLSTSIWTSFTVSYFYICKILAIHLFNALSPTNMVSTVTQIRSGIIYHNLLYYFDVHLKLMYSYHLNRSYHIGDILYYVLTTIKFSTFLKVEICILINCPISSFQSSIFHWNTYETSHRVINHSLVGSLRLIHIISAFILNIFNIRVITHMLSDILYYNWFYYLYVQLIFITPYYLYLYLDNKYLHIYFPVFLSYNGITKIFQNTFTFFSITILTFECKFFSLCPCYLHYVHVVVQFNIVFLFIGMYYSTSVCTCMMSNFSVIYMYMNSLLIFNTVYVSDIIQVPSHYVPKGKPMRGGLALVNRLSRVGKYQTYTDYG